MTANLSSDAMRFRWFLLVVSCLVAAIDIGVIVQDRLDDGGGASDQVIDVPPAADGGTTTTSADGAGGDAEVRPAPGQVRITGTITAMHLESALLEPRLVPTPLTLVSDRGFGNGGELTDVSISGQGSTIVWDGGRPFVLSSGPGLVLDPVTVDLTPEGLRLLLGGTVHALEAGTYRLNTPVAVGSAGIATSRDAVTFDAADDSLFAATGDTALLLGPTGPHRFLGPGSVHLEGDLTITRSDGSGSARSFDLPEGVYDITIAPGPSGGWTIAATAGAEPD